MSQTISDFIPTDMQSMLFVVTSLFSIPAGFRHRSRLLHNEEFYFPSPCYGITNHTTRVIMSEFHARLKDSGCTDCNLNDAFLHCPAVNGSIANFTELMSDRYKRAAQHKILQKTEKKEWSSISVFILLLLCIVRMVARNSTRQILFILWGQVCLIAVRVPVV